ncbi:hypothetical protein L218DRAFT_999270 [Marasmius fiardii PR-910]|nr:hypothetical protein L218DRAFT_999270 [Marasmius fiardii PR-910]
MAPDPNNPATIAHGYMFIGVVLNVCMMGVAIMQTYLYFITFRHRDPRWLKSLVGFVFFANLLNTGFVTADLYLALVSHYSPSILGYPLKLSLTTISSSTDDPPFLTVSTWIFITDPVLVGLVAGSIQLFFSWRVRILTGSIVLGLVTAGLSLAQIICAMLMAWKVAQNPGWGEFARFTDLIYAWMISTILVDIVITVILYNDLRRGHKTGMKSDALVDRVIRSAYFLRNILLGRSNIRPFSPVAIQTGALTSVWALLDLVTFLAMPLEATHLIFQLSMIKLYTHSLMSSLNSRGAWVTKADETTGLNTTGKLVRSDIRLNQNMIRVDAPQHDSEHSIKVQVERHELVDIPPDMKV